MIRGSCLASNCPSTRWRLAELVADEAALRERLLQRLERAGVDVVDVLSELRTANTQPYQSADGRLNPAGHVIVADRVAAWVLKRVPIARSGNTTRTCAPPDSRPLRGRGAAPASDRDATRARRSRPSGPPRRADQPWRAANPPKTSFRQ
jgi:hypothetical protein